MSEVRYQFVFSDLMDSDSAVTMSINDTVPRTLFVSVDDGQLLSVSHGPPSSIIYDLVDLATAVNTADRLAPNRHNQKREISIELPVRNPDALGSITEDVLNILFFLTHDDWKIRFTKRSNVWRASELQLNLLREVASLETPEVALWSGGLDSLAGLCARIEGPRASRYIMVGSGNNRQVFRTQSDVVSHLRKRVKTNLGLVQVPIDRNDTADIPKDRMLRSRGFVFILMGVAVAVSAGADNLHIYENGIGAINLPYYQSEIGMDHSRSVHPISLAKLSSIISRLIERNFEICNPFVFYTKAQMCDALIRTELTDIVAQTSSCDRPQRTHAAQQCGVCSSCLLRREALAASGIVDRTPYFVPGKRRARKGDWSHFEAMSSQVNRLSILLGNCDQWESVCTEYPMLRETAMRLALSTSMTENQIETHLVNMYQQYVNEWSLVGTVLEHVLRGE